MQKVQFHEKYDCKRVFAIIFQARFLFFSARLKSQTYQLYWLLHSYSQFQRNIRKSHRWTIFFGYFYFFKESFFPKKSRFLFRKLYCKNKQQSEVSVTFQTCFVIKFPRVINLMSGRFTHNLSLERSLWEAS